MPITLNPIFDLKPQQPALYYLDEGVALAAGIGNPEGLVIANIGALISAQNGHLYQKQTGNGLATGWVQVDGGGGGAGTVTSFSAGNLSPLFTSSVATPTTTPALTFALNTQLANLVFAGPSTGAAAAPTFRALVAADIPGIAPPPNFSIPYNNGSNVFEGDSSLTFDPLTFSLLLGVTGKTGNLQLRNTNGAAFKFLTNNPVSANVTLPDALPTALDLLTATAVSGSNVTWGYVARSSIGASGANPSALVGLTTVNGVAATFMRSDAAPPLSQAIAPTWTQQHIWQTSNAAAVSIGPNGDTNPVLRVVTNVASQAAGLSVTGNAAGSGVTLTALSSAASERITIASKGASGFISLTDGNGNRFESNASGRSWGVYNAAEVNPRYGFGSNQGFVASAGSATVDTSLLRHAVSVWRTGDGATGLAQLQIAAGVTQRGNLHVEPSANTLPALWLSFASATGSDAPIDAARRSRGTNASPAVVQDGDILRIIRANGQFNTSDGNFTPGGEIRFVAKETWSGSQNGAQMEFYTAPLGGGAIAQVGKFHASGAFCVGANPTTVNAVNKLVVGNSIGFNTDVLACFATGSVDTTTTTADFQVGAGSTAYFNRYFELGDSTARGRVNVNGQHEEQVGRSGTFARTPGVWQSNITPTGNSGAGETTLHSYTITGNSLRVDKDGIRGRGAGRCAANGNAKQLRFKFGATTFGDTGSVIVNGASFTFDFEVIRTGATAQLCFIAVNNILAGVVGLFGLTNSTTAAETLSGNVTLAITGQGAASNDIILDYSRIEYNPATI